MCVFIVGVYQGDAHYSLDYVCVRYSNMSVSDEPVLEEDVAAVVNSGLDVTWVAHCRVTDVAPFPNGLVVRLALVHSRCVTWSMASSGALTIT